MAPRQHAPDAHWNLTGNYNFNYSYHPITVRQNRENGAPFCLGENPDFKQFDLCYSFKALVCVEYGGFGLLHEAAWNYRNNRVAAFNHSEDARMSYEKGVAEPGSFPVCTLHSRPSSAMGPGKVTRPSWHWNV